MVILKKIVIMTEHGKSNCSGIVKFENFAGRTSCFVRILGMRDNGVICIKCGDEIMYCGELFEGEKKFNALYDLDRRIRVAVMREGAIVSMGSSRGKFPPDEILPDIHRYFAGASTKAKEEEERAEETPALKIIEEENIEEVFKQEEEDAGVNAEEEKAPAAEEAQEIQSAPIKKSKSVAKVKTVQPPEPFYKKIEENMNQLFEKNTRDDELALLIPHSKWARVSTGEEGYYVVGIIYNEEIPEIICYGVPDKDKNNPPQSEESCRQWMEIEKGGRGYWMMYQSAKTGETLTEDNVQVG